jgi:predicted transcriptional regulator
MSTNLGFVSRFIDFTKEYESPTSFWKWSAIATVAATLRYNVFFPHGLGKIYPNVYTLLLADSAEYRKDAGPKLASELLREVANTKVIEGRGSFQAITEALAYDVANKKTGGPLRGGACIIIAPELAAFFVSDPQLIPNITSWYDFREEHVENLKSGKLTIKNRCINLLAASNETFLREVYDDRAIYGGLLRRTFMVKPDETRPPNSLMYEQTIYDKTPLIEELKEIKDFAGPIARTEAAAKFYDRWYKELYAKYKTHPDRTGVLQSIHISVLKLAIIIAVSRGTMEITKEIFEDAVLEMTALKPNYEAYSVGVGKSEASRVGAVILKMLWQVEKNEMSRRDILLRVWSDISAEDLDKLVVTLEQSGLIRTKAFQNIIKYELTEKGKTYFEVKKS